MVQELAHLKAIIKKQNSIINKLYNDADALSQLRSITRKDQIKEGMLNIIATTEELAGNRTILHPALNAAIKAAQKLKGDSLPKTTAGTQTIPPGPPQPHEPDHAVHLEVHDRLDKQDAKLEKIMATLAANKGPCQHRMQNSPTANPGPQSVTLNHSTPAPRESEDWTIVKRKKRNKSENIKPFQMKNKNSYNNRTKRPPPNAIVIKPSSGKSFAEILKDVDVERTAAHITSIAESRNGEVIIRVTRGERKRANLETVIRDALGADPLYAG